MAKNILKKINWELFLKHTIAKAFRENLDEEEFAKNLRAFVRGDERFRKIIGANSLTNDDIVEIIRYMKNVISRRRFLKSAAAFTIVTAAGLSKDHDQLVTPTYQSSYNGRLPIKGIGYDIGTRYTPTFITRAELNTEIMNRELYVIKNDLNCNSVRIYGEDINKLIECSKIAFNLGLQIWLSPRLINGSEAETLNYIRTCAIEAEKLRVFDPNIVFIVGNELTLDMKGLVPGDTYQERGGNLFGNIFWNTLKGIFSKGTPNYKLNEFLKKVVAEVRQVFRGNITYAASNWEKIEWNSFDIVGINHYLNISNKLTYRDKLRELKKFKKPIAVLEFGCGSYKGAEDKGGSSYNIVNWNLPKPEITGSKVKDENVQANYILDLLNIFVQEGIYAAFVHTFVETHYPADDDNQKYDLDMASFNVIKVYPQGHPKSYFQGHIIPKKSFFTITKFYGGH